MQSISHRSGLIFIQVHDVLGECNTPLRPVKYPTIPQLSLPLGRLRNTWRRLILRHGRHPSIGWSPDAGVRGAFRFLRHPPFDQTHPDTSRPDLVTARSVFTQFHTPEEGFCIRSFPEHISKNPTKPHFMRFSKGLKVGSNPPLSASFYWGFQQFVDSSTKFPHKFPRSCRTAKRGEPGTEPESPGLESDGKFTGPHLIGPH